MTSPGTDPKSRAAWLTTVVLGITYAISGLHHGVFEALQGNRPTPGLFIASIGPEHVRWEHGTDGAFTLIPNFLVTGIAAIAVSLAIVAWCLFCLRRRRGPAGFLALLVLLTLVGGGIGHIVFFVSAWAYAARMRNGPPWLGRALGAGRAGRWAGPGCRRWRRRRSCSSSPSRHPSSASSPASPSPTASSPGSVPFSWARC